MTNRPAGLPQQKFKVMKANAKQILQETYRSYNNLNMSLREYIERESEFDPTFFNWLFEDFDNDNTVVFNQHESEWEEFIENIKE